MRQTIVLTLALILLLSCGTVNSDTIATVCPPVVEYPHAFLSRAADEIEKLPNNSAIEQMIKDYYVMREQSRACAPHRWFGVGGVIEHIF